MVKAERPVVVGDRWEDKDKRQGNRVVRIVEIDSSGDIEYVVEVAELNPDTVGNKGWLSETTLRKRYWRVSR